MRSHVVALVAVSLIIGCADVDSFPFDEWPDYSTTAIFMDNEPTCEELQAWYDVCSAATEAWGAAPGPMRIWFVRSPWQLVFLDGEVRPWPEGCEGKATWGGGRIPTVYVTTFQASWSVEAIMCHEVTHAYWGIEDHGDEFSARLRELTETAREPAQYGSLIP
jgi:hypothetical protein